MTTPADRIYAGTLADFDDSMAQEIENALASASLLGPLPSAPQKLVDDRRKLFIAIANGVINHLEKHPEAIEVIVDLVAATTTTNIKVRH